MPSRRQFLAALGAVGTGGVAGCSGRVSELSGEGSVEPLAMRDEDMSGWRRPANDPANTRFAPDATPPTATPESTWRVPVDHQAGGPPVVEDGRVFVPEFFGVKAVDAESDEVQWTFETPEEDPFAAVNDGVNVVDGAVVFTDIAGRLHVLDADTGEERWRFSVAPDDTFVTWPVVAEGLDRVTYVGTRRGRLYAFNVHEGEVTWSRRAFGGVEHAVAFRDVGMHGSVLAVPTTAGVECYDQHGRGLWVTQLPTDPAAAPTVAHGRVYVACEDEHLYALDRDTGDRVWRTRILPEHVDGSFYDPSIAVDGEWVYAATSYSLYGVNPDTGRKRWGFKPPDREALRTAPVVANDTVYVGAESGLFGVKIGAGTGVGTLRFEPSRWKLDARAFSMDVAVVGDRLYAPVVDEKESFVVAFE